MTIAELLHEAAETHPVIYRSVNGDDPGSASWYADWLLAPSELPQVLGAVRVRSHLVHALVQLDREYKAEPRDEPLGGLVRARASRPAAAMSRWLLLALATL